MILLRGARQLTRIHQATVATIGNFDGFHLGHQKIIQYVMKETERLAAKSVLITFEPTAKEFFAGDNAPARIYPVRQKIELAVDFGFDYFACLHFNQSLTRMPAVDFVQKILHDSLQIKSLVVGDDFRFGYQRQGDIHLLRGMGTELGFVVKDQNTILHGQTRVSSSLIRQKLASGDFDEAAKLLGRPFCVSGHVFHGDKKGRTIGFPTANILIKRKVSPIRGVFTVTTELNEKRWLGVANVGTRPTVGGDRPQLEVHLFNCQQNLYGKYLNIEFHSKLRDEIKFSSFEALQEQINLDVAQAQQYFSQRT